MKGGKLQFAAVCTEVRIADLVAVGPKRGNGGYFSSMYFHIQDRCDRSDQFVSEDHLMENSAGKLNDFVEHMKSQGWLIGKNQYELLKDDWKIFFDTSSWIEVSTKQASRIFDVPVPEKHLVKWTENLILHLCESSDKLSRDIPKS